MNKRILSAFLFSAMLIAALLLTACSFSNNSDGDTGDDSIKDVYASYVAYATENGKEPLSYESWLETIKGEKGDPGANGLNGLNGKDGITPEFKLEGGTLYVSYDNWVTKTSLGYINGEDGAPGQNGATGAPGSDGVGIANISTELVSRDGSSYIVFTYYMTDGTTKTSEVSLGDISNDENVEPDEPSEDEYEFVDFTAEEKEIFNEYVGLVIPFAPTNEYQIEAIDDSGDYSLGIRYITTSNTEEEFEAYRELFSDYTFDGTEYDEEYGDTWYLYSKGDVLVDMVYYLYEGYYYIDVYVYLNTEDVEPDAPVFSEIVLTVDSLDIPSSTYLSDSRDVSGVSFEFIQIGNYGDGIQMRDKSGKGTSMLWNTTALGKGIKEIKLVYSSTQSTYTNVNAIIFTFGNSAKGANYTTTLSTSAGVSTYTVTPDKDSYTYFYLEHDCSYSFYWESITIVFADGTTSGGQGSGSTNLPEDEDGVFNVDFTKAEGVKDVTDQGNYIGGCPTTGSPAVLVIPVQFSDAKASTKGYTIDTLKNAFYKDGKNDYYSLYDYYYISSYGKLTLDITVLDSWFTPKYSSSYYKNYEIDGELLGEQLVMDEALDYLDDFMDLSVFDSDGNGIIDAVVLINTLEIDTSYDLNWAFRYWNFYVDDDNNYYEYDGVSANDYLWASYQFLFDDMEDDVYDDENLFNTFTFIHEFGHVLGLTDYYDTSGKNDPMTRRDMMDDMPGDHNAFSKINLGWITTSRLVVADGSITLRLEDFSETGDTIIIANNWDEKLGAYQEYYIITYYTNGELNSGIGGYFSQNGVLVYHVNAELFNWEYGGEIYTDIYNTNTDESDEYGTKNNLIEYVKASDGSYLFTAGDTLPSLKDDNGNTLSYTFTVDALTESEAIITFTRK